MDEATIQAIAGQRGLPSMVACELAHCLANSGQGIAALRRMMEQDLRRARMEDREDRVSRITRALSDLDRLDNRRGIHSR